MSWLQKRRSPRPSASPKPGLVSSGSEERASGPKEVTLRCDEGGLKNPMGNIPEALKERFPHWTESIPTSANQPAAGSGSDVDRSIHYSSSFKAPDYTIPYMVMDRDTINSIAIRFETTPGDIARINRKQGPSFLIFPGDVIYVPDIEYMPKSPDPPTTPPAEQPSNEKQSSSHMTTGDGHVSPIRSGARGVTPLHWSTDALEEVEDTHLSIISKFMSEDQGCIHGSLVVNHMTMMFTPHTTDPLVQEHGKVHFEIVLPINDVTYAALTKDVAAPVRLPRVSEASGSSTSVVSSGVARAASDGSTELSLSMDNPSTSQELTVPIITFRTATPEPGEVASEDVTPVKAESAVSMPIEDGDFPSIKTIVGDESKDEQLSQEIVEDGSSAPEEEETQAKDNEVITREEPKGIEQESGGPSIRNPGSDEPVFMHIHVRPKPGTTYTYTPINSSVGIDIPSKGKGTRSSKSPTVQQVKTWFCFAFAEKRASDMVKFLCTHHKDPLPIEDKSLDLWIEGSYEFINTVDQPIEGLDFCEDHFDTSSWEIYSLQDLHQYRRRLTALEDLDLPLPSLSEEPTLLMEDHLKKLVGILPSNAVDHPWTLVYSTFRDGISLRTMYRNMVSFENEDSPIVLVLRDDQLKIFGAITTCPIRMSEKFYGKGESSLFSFNSPTEMNHFFWSGANHYIVKGNSNSLSIGSGDGHPGLWIDENFYHGSSYECSTFNNDILASSQDFICTGAEAWGFL